jgi:hypothetical protein
MADKLGTSSLRARRSWKCEPRVYDESPISPAAEFSDDSTRCTTMSSDINTAQRSGGRSNYKPLLAFLDKDMVKEVQR